MVKNCNNFYQYIYLKIVDVTFSILVGENQINDIQIGNSLTNDLFKTNKSLFNEMLFFLSKNQNDCDKKHIKV